MRSKMKTKLVNVIYAEVFSARMKLLINPTTWSSELKFKSNYLEFGSLLCGPAPRPAQNREMSVHLCRKLTGIFQKL